MTGPAVGATVPTGNYGPPQRQRRAIVALQRGVVVRKLRDEHDVVSAERRIVRHHTAVLAGDEPCRDGSQLRSTDGG